jgi:hypothetical protein
MVGRDEKGIRRNLIKSFTRTNRLRGPVAGGCPDTSLLAYNLLPTHPKSSPSQTIFQTPFTLLNILDIFS